MTQLSVALSNIYHLYYSFNFDKSLSKLNHHSDENHVVSNNLKFCCLTKKSENIKAPYYWLCDW